MATLAELLNVEEAPKKGATVGSKFEDLVLGAAPASAPASPSVAPAGNTFEELVSGGAAPMPDEAVAQPSLESMTPEQLNALPMSAADLGKATGISAVRPMKQLKGKYLQIARRAGFDEDISSRVKRLFGVNPEGLPDRVKALLALAWRVPLSALATPIATVGQAVEDQAAKLGYEPDIYGPGSVTPGQIAEWVPVAGGVLGKAIESGAIRKKAWELVEKAGLGGAEAGSPEVQTLLKEFTKLSKATGAGQDLARMRSLGTGAVTEEAMTSTLGKVKATKDLTALMEEYKAASDLGYSTVALQGAKEQLVKAGMIKPAVGIEGGELTADLLKTYPLTRAGTEKLLKSAAKADPKEFLDLILKTNSDDFIKIVPGSAENVLFNSAHRLANAMHRGITLVLHDIVRPQAVLSLEPGGMKVFNAIRGAEAKITKDVGRLEKILLDVTRGMSKGSLERIGHFLDGEAVQLLPDELFAATTIRRKILDPIARLHKLPKEGRFLQDYFPHFFDKYGAPKDVVEAMAKKMVGDTPWASLSPAEQGLALEKAGKYLKGVPTEVFAGPISMHRLTEKSPFNFNVRDVISRYVRVTVKKHYTDLALKDTHRLLPGFSPELRAYVAEYINGFRGVPTIRDNMVSNAIRGWVDALESTGRGGKILADMTKATLGQNSRDFTNLLKAIQADAKLGANLFSPIQNLSQTSINTYTKVGGKTLLQALKMRHTEAGRRLLERSGVFLDVAKYELLPSEMKGAFGKYTDGLLYLFNKSEKFNREVAYLAGYLKAQQANPLAHYKALNDAGRKMVDVTQFIFSPSGRPLFLNTGVGSTLGQFKLFTINQLAFIKNLRGSEVPRFVLSTALHGGLKGVPGAQTVMKLLVGYNALQWVKDQDFPQWAENLLIGGLPREIGLNLSGDVGTGFVPSTPKELVPATLSLPVNAARNIGGALQGDPAAKELMLREAIRNIPAGGVQLERARQAILAAGRKGAKLDPGGKVMYRMTPRELLTEGLLGAKTTSAAQKQERMEYVQEIKKTKYMLPVKRLRSEATKAILENDPRRLVKALAAAEQNGVLQNTQLGQELLQTGSVREFLSLPKKVRAEMVLKNPGYVREILKEIADSGILARE